MRDQRGEPRQRVLLSGKVVLPGGGVIDCTVRDRSAGGARLKLPSAVGIPNQFKLHVSSTGETLNVKVAWRKLSEIGVMFVAI